MPKYAIKAASGRFYVYLGMWERTCDMENNGVRINKFLSEAGVCSGRQAGGGWKCAY